MLSQLSSLSPNYSSQISNLHEDTSSNELSAKVGQVSWPILVDAEPGNENLPILISGWLREP